MNLKNENLRKQLTMVEGQLHSRKRNGLETLEEVEKLMSIRLCDGFKEVLEEASYERPTTILVGEQDEEFQTIVPQEPIDYVVVTQEPAVEVE